MPFLHDGGIVGAVEPSGYDPGSSYWLTRFVILRLLGFVYFIAFLGLVLQALPLFGSHGLLPVPLFLHRLAEQAGSRFGGFLLDPSLFWLGASDTTLTIAAWIGTALSLIVLVGYANGILMAVLWMLYMSFVHIGQDWYGYGWEIQLCETGFLAIFLCPLLDGRPFPKRPPPVLVIWLHRWLIFRIMLGAGLIKMRGDSCWRDLTCLYYHYETQPMPNPLSRTLHFMPHWFHQFGALFNHVCELVAPWFAFGPRLARRAAGVFMLVFQIILILSGNLSFLNWLTIVPVLACFDDGFLAPLLPRSMAARARRAAVEELSLRTLQTGLTAPDEAKASTHNAEVRRKSAFFRIVNFKDPQSVAAFVLALLVAVLSVKPVLNLVSGKQVMNTSFDRLDLVNTYGAFGSVGMERLQLVFEGTDSPTLDEQATWKEYPFKCQPGNLRRRPCIVAPYQERLDWQVWFAAMSTPERYPWTLHFVWKLLHNDPGTLSLLDGNPFPGAPPRYIRARLYRYAFARPDDPGDFWWTRTLLTDWLPPLSTDDHRLRQFLEAYGWTGASEEPSPRAVH